jgi:hypothetical protein
MQIFIVLDKCHKLSVFYHIFLTNAVYIDLKTPFCTLLITLNKVLSYIPEK